MNEFTGNQDGALETVLTEQAENARLKAEVVRLQQQLAAYTNAISNKVDSLEADMEKLIHENDRQITLRQSAEVERDACVALAAELALAAGVNAGSAEGGVVVIDLPSGQVSWELAPSEAHLLARLPRYGATIENVEITTKYERVMNSGVRASGRA